MDFEKFLTKQVKHFAKELIKEGTGTKKPRRGFSDSVKKTGFSLSKLSLQTV